MLKPQDIVVLLHIATKQGALWSFAALHQELGISTSEIHGSLQRASVARLYVPESREPQHHALTEFCVHGLKYAFPATVGGPTRGIGTCSGSQFPFPFTFEKAETLVWPYAEGSVRGSSVQPLYSSLPAVIERLPELYYLLVLIDFIRLGRSRERLWAEKTIAEILEQGRVHGTKS